MADITKCGNKNCPIRGKCYRYTATANPTYQSYADFTPELDYFPSGELLSVSCEGFYSNNPSGIIEDENHQRGNIK